MSVQEILERLPALTEAERRLLREALDNQTRGQTSSAAAGTSELADLWELIATGWHDTGGRSLAEGIDAALYGPAPQ
ncbi:MAG: hypothetical protein IT204_12295 [Fimbriimonadaceae bacterium]|nr:hypothetical protein [Fimbriimonadaceae bacterium]